MITNFKCRDTQALFAGHRVRHFVAIESAAMRKLAMLDDLRIPPGNRLEALKGNRVGSWSIRINDQWRLCFRLERRDASDVEIVDYH